MSQLTGSHCSHPVTAHILGFPLRYSQVLQAGGFPAGEGLELLHYGLWLSFLLLICLVLTPRPEQGPTPQPAPHPAPCSSWSCWEAQFPIWNAVDGWDGRAGCTLILRREHPVHPETDRAGTAQVLSPWERAGPGSAGLRWGLVLRGVRAFGTAFVPGMLSHSDTVAVQRVAFWVSPLEGLGTLLSVWR